MKAKLLSLNIDKSMSFSRFQARLDSSLKAYTGDNLEVEQFDDIRKMFGALQGALESEELIIAAVDVKNYLRFKTALIQAFGNDAVYDPTVLNKMEKIAEVSDKVRKAFAVFPEAATVFVSEDGLYSGFGIENGSQCAICIPIDNNRIDVILRNGVIPFLSKTFGSMQEDVLDSKVKNAYNQRVSVAVKRILDSNSIVAVNGTTNAEALKSCGDSVEGFSKAFVFTPHVEDKGNVNATEYAAQLAKVSLDLSAANIGACISDIYTSGDVNYLCIAVASEQSAIVRKLYMAEGESESAFIESAAIELIELVGEKVAGIRSVGIEINDEPSSENAITDKDKKAVGKKPLIFLAVLMSLIIALCVAFVAVYFVQGEDGELAQFLNSVFNKEETTEVVSKKETTTEEKEFEDVVPEEKVSMLPISDYIVKEFLTTQQAPVPSTVSTPPSVITVNGEYYNPQEAIARLISVEIDVTNYEVEAVKAQAVAVYSFLKYRNNGYVIEGVVISDTCPDDILKIVESVFGQFVSMNNNVVITPYHNLSVGRTLSVAEYLPYLQSVTIANVPEMSAESNKTVKKISLDDMKKMLLSFDNQFLLSDDPSTWISITHDSAISSEVGNIVSVKIGGKSFVGPTLRSLILGQDVLVSGCCSIQYIESEQAFEITSYGQGDAVGMSLAGANYMAKNGSDYKTILSTYYVGTTIAVEA